MKYAEETLSFGGSVSAGMGEISTGGDRSLSSADVGHDMVMDGSVNSVPLSYVHQDDSKKRRMVKFRSDTKRNAKRRTGPAGSRYPASSNSTVNSSNSLLDTNSRVQDIEPQALDEEQNVTLMNQISNQILASIGSWEAGSVFCGNDTAEKTATTYHDGQSARLRSNHHQHQSLEPEDEMTVEWEGQEVQLVDHSIADYDGSVASEDRMPPPQKAVPDTQASSAFSSLGSCHSWLPVSDQISSAASYFSGRENAEGSLDIDGAAAMASDHSAGASTTRMMGADGSLASIGGSSLTRVFEDEVLPDTQTSIGTSSNVGPRVLASMPSWERNLRSRSPLSIESDDEDLSLISKSSSKHSAEYSAPHMNPAHGMSWEQKE